MSLIPKGNLRGKVIVWDYEHQTGASWTQRWSIIDPLTHTFQNHELDMPANGGDLFCSAHCWTAAGDLFVAGGTTRYPEVGSYQGGRLVYLYKPDIGPDGTWARQPDLLANRFYPTVSLLGNDQILVLGGTSDMAAHMRNDYEAFDPATATWQDVGGSRLIAGPGFPADDFQLYPRAVLLSTGELFIGGMGGYSSKVDHLNAPGSWIPTSAGTFPFRYYDALVLHPNVNGIQDVVWKIAGEAFNETSSVGPTANVQSCWAGAGSAPDWNWRNAPFLKGKRSQFNAVLLPDSSILVVGGRTNPGGGLVGSFTKTPEIYKPSQPGWTELAQAVSYRDYHSTSVLLPDGRILVGGGEARTWDYEIFVPPYIACGWPRPVITSAASTMDYASVNPAPVVIQHQQLPRGGQVAKVVLMRAASTTHHSDSDQRYVELSVVQKTPTSISVTPPWDSNAAPRGYYMLFVVTKAGIPSEASWVRLR